MKRRRIHTGFWKPSSNAYCLGGVVELEDGRVDGAGTAPILSHTEVSPRPS